MFEAVDNFHMKIGRENSLIIIHRLNRILSLKKRLSLHRRLMMRTRSSRQVTNAENGKVGLIQTLGRVVLIRDHQIERTVVEVGRRR